MTNEYNQLSSDIDNGQGIKRVKSPIITAGLPFKGIEMTRAIITALLLGSLVVAVVHIVYSINLCAPAHHSF